MARRPAIGERTEQDTALWSAVHSSTEDIATQVDHFRFRDALASAMNVARAGNKYLTDTEPWKLEKTDPERTRTRARQQPATSRRC